MINEQLICKKLNIKRASSEIFEHLVHLDHAILLDSTNSAHENARFDIISALPKTTIEVKNKQTFVDGKPHPDGPFVAIKSALNELSSAPAPHELPFSGGILGAFSYDLGRAIENLPTIAHADITFPEMVVGIYVDALIYDKIADTWFYIAQPQCDRLALFLNFIDVEPSLAPFALSSSWHSNMDEASYQFRFNKIQHYLVEGDCYQINLAQRFQAHYKGHPYYAYLKLRNANNAPFSAYYNCGKHQILSLSPERFIKVTDAQVETKPIKGTLPRSSDPIKDQANASALARSEKDHAENVMIVDLLRNDLGKVAKPGSVEVPKLFDIESFSAVHHLVSTVRSTLADNKSAVDQLEAAFPGGSITGAPKIRAMEIIDELEPHRRSIYCGSIGYLSACGNMDSSITIRTLITEDNSIYCWAGGGIVADSKCELEFQETLDKVNKILPELL